MAKQGFKEPEMHTGVRVEGGEDTNSNMVGNNGWVCWSNPAITNVYTDFRPGKPDGNGESCVIIGSGLNRRMDDYQCLHNGPVRARAVCMTTEEPVHDDIWELDQDP